MCDYDRLLRFAFFSDRNSEEARLDRDSVLSRSLDKSPNWVLVAEQEVYAFGQLSLLF